MNNRKFKGKTIAELLGSSEDIDAQELLQEVVRRQKNLAQFAKDLQQSNSYDEWTQRMLEDGRKRMDQEKMQVLKRFGGGE